MRKQEFLVSLKARLSGLPRKEVEERLGFYREMIDDRMEEGMPEERAVAAVGSVEKVASQIIAEVPLSAIVKGEIRNKRKLSGWEIALLVLGFPLWFPLLISVFSIGLSLYLSIWSIVVSLWAIFISMLACGFSGVIVGGVFIGMGNQPAEIVLIGASLVCLGITILFSFACKAATKGMVLFTKKMVLGLKNCFVKKEA